MLPCCNFVSKEKNNKRLKMRRRARPHLAVSTLRICSRSDLPQKASVCFLNLCLIVSSCFYRHILGIYDSCALGGKGDRETGGSVLPGGPNYLSGSPGGEWGRAGCPLGSAEALLPRTSLWQALEPTCFPLGQSLRAAVSWHSDTSPGMILNLPMGYKVSC